MALQAMNTGSNPVGVASFPQSTDEKSLPARAAMAGRKSTSRRQDRLRWLRLRTRLVSMILVDKYDGLPLHRTKQHLERLGLSLVPRSKKSEVGGCGNVGKPSAVCPRRCGQGRPRAVHIDGISTALSCRGLQRWHILPQGDLQQFHRFEAEVALVYRPLVVLLDEQHRHQAQG